MIKGQVAITVENKNSRSFQHNPCESDSTSDKQNNSSIENSFQSKADGNAVEKQNSDSLDGSNDDENTDYGNTERVNQSKEQNTDYSINRTSLKEYLVVSNCEIDMDDSTEDIMEITLSGYCSDENIISKTNESFTSNFGPSYMCKPPELRTTVMSATGSKLDVKNACYFETASSKSQNLSEKKNSNVSTVYVDSKLEQDIGGTFDLKSKEESCITHDLTTVLYSVVNLPANPTEDSSSPNEITAKTTTSPVGSSGLSSSLEENSDSVIEEQTSMSPWTSPNSIFEERTSNFQKQSCTSCELYMECDSDDESENPSSEDVVSRTELSHSGYKPEGQTSFQCIDSTAIVPKEGSHHGTHSDSSTSLNLFEDKIHKDCSQLGSVEEKCSSNKGEMVDIISKTIKSEPVDNGYEQPKSNPIPDTASRNVDSSAVGGMIKTEVKSPTLAVGGMIKTEVISPTLAVGGMIKTEVKSPTLAFGGMIKTEVKSPTLAVGGMIKTEVISPTLAVGGMIKTEVKSPTLAVGGMIKTEVISPTLAVGGMIKTEVISPTLAVGGMIKTEVKSPTLTVAVKTNAHNSDPSHQKGVIKTIPQFQKQKVIKSKPPVVLPSVDSEKKIPVAIMNTGSNGPGLSCSYIIPINTSFGTTSQYQTFVRTISNGKPILKKIDFTHGVTNFKKKSHKSNILHHKIKSETASKVNTLPETITLNLPIAGGKKVATATSVIGIKSIYISDKIEALTSGDGKKKMNETEVNFRLKSLDIAGISQLVQRKNIIKTYKAPTPPPNMNILKVTHVCTECGDSFLLESSLKDHFARCSMAIQYHCRACQVKLLFTNKCSLLKHLRCHSRSPDQIKQGALQIQADNISVLSVLEGNMPKINKKLTVEQLKKVKIVQAIKKNPCPECGQETHLKMSHHFGSLGVICNFKHMCKDCSMYLPTSCSLSAHQRLHSFKEPFVCPECGNIFTSLFNFKNHLKLECYHIHRAPVFVCPICNVFVCTAASLKQHFVMEHQKILYWDKKCFEVFATYQQFLDHRAQFHQGSTSDHGVSFFCEICKANLLLKLLINHMYSHIATIKQNIPFGYVCISCRDEKKVLRIFFVKKDLIKHMELHKEGLSIPCSECSMMFVTDDELAEHELKFHKVTHKNTCKHCKVPVDDMKSHLKHCEFASIAALFENTVSPDYSKRKVMFPPDEFSSVLDALNKNGCTAKHKSMEEDVKVDVNEFKCKHCGDERSKTFKQFARHIAVHVRGGVLICSKCQRKDFGSFGEMKSHQIVCGLDFSKMNDGSSTMYSDDDAQCKDCDRHFKDSTALKKHVKQEHTFYPCHLCCLLYRRQDDLDIHINTVHRGKKSAPLSCHLCKGKKGRGKMFMRRDLYNSHMANAHGISEMPHQEKLSKRKAVSTDAGSPLKKLKVSDSDKYSCVKCEFVTANSDEFSVHIVKHKSDNSVQCPICGLCFSVLPAVRRHLLVVHKTKNVDKLIEDKGLQVPDDDDEEDDDMSVLERRTSSYSLIRGSSPEEICDNPKQCPVCKKIFDTQAEKKFHMRTHGMAFISSRHRELSKKAKAADADLVSNNKKCPEKPTTSLAQKTNKPSPISLTKSVNVSNKIKIQQPANQPIVNVERMDIKK